ncbi:MAG: PilZ domain-containing protein [Myxococcota bacterium]
MGRIKRRRRVRCKLQCEIVQPNQRPMPARMVALSEGGFAVITTLSLIQGESVRVLIKPDVGGAPIRVSGIVWNEVESSQLGTSSRLHRLGCVVSDPPPAYLALLDRLSPPPRPDPVPVAVPIRRDTPAAEEAEADLPRSRELQPPPKREPEETLPYFRIRMRQIGGPRTRILTLRARSASHAEQLALDELARICRDSEGWGVLHVSRVAAGPR